MDNKNIPDDAVETWDVSVYTNTRKVMAWIVDDPNNEGFYKLYIGANGKPKADSFTCYYMFYFFTELETVNFNDNFDTSNAVVMSSMFEDCSSLTSIDLTSFDTSRVSSMSNMFDYCISLTSANLSNLDTSNLTGVVGMFQQCTLSLGLQQMVEMIILNL